VTSEGGFINPSANLNALPIVEVLSDGRILTVGPVDAIAPAPLLPTVQVRATGAAGAAAILAAIKEALSVEEVGADTVDGVNATHYRASVDLVKLLPLLASLTPDKPTDAEMQHAKDQLAKLGMQTLPIELWVDADGFLKQMQLALDLSKMGVDHAGTSFSLTFTLSDIGENVSIDVPPASQVTDIGDLLGSALSPVTSLA
jgi:hypothetical protein